MKTPIRELAERLREYRDEEESLIVKRRLNSVLVDVLGLLQKEKELIARAFVDGYEQRYYPTTEFYP